MTKISQLSNATPASDDSVPIYQGSSGGTRRFTLANLLTFLGRNRFLPSKFYVYRTGTQSLSINTWTKVQLNSEVFDNNSDFDNATNYRFVVPYTGFYKIYGQVNIGTSGIATSAYAQMALYANGGAVKNSGRLVGSGNTNTIPILSTETFQYLTAGDYIEMYAYCSEGSRAVGGGSDTTFLHGHLVGST